MAETKSTTKLTSWDRVKLARHPERPTTFQYIDAIFDEFIELHGDRLFREDGSIVGGIATIKNQVFTVIGQQKGRDTNENISRMFGMPHPEGYRKALRLMKQAEKFNRPIITFVDTPGAYPGLGAEERGQAEAIARNLLEMSKLSVPVISFIIGEGGSGGAIAIAVGNRVVMLENSIYSILSPEGYATILWKDASKASDAANEMKLCAPDLKKLGLIDDIVKEGKGGAHLDLETTAKNIKKYIVDAMKDYVNKTPKQIRTERNNKFRKFGEFERFTK